ncbi:MULTISPECIES: MGMT family protein [Acinetobacter]|jgi:methylated-DNA-protein-cysteine methyltransferase-like protein|uniref:MGMT family protein n=2 Tax=Acinetobacter johnsonii TaxID=40214 RepID=A0A2W5RR25_ACIJO|nr:MULTISPECIES: MGMT family protein [Acinetobacter]OYW68635.1 MAG: methyltransferase [Pseudomonadales bacterium 32-42-5]AZN64844.1 methyltransferase [Acinetobacter johnsonii]EEY96546.1 6-O-methylguanine DNA methyltransferase, DNA binding domain protein [Acinetobacter johnsonii SH046]MDH0825274.1 MGMT family protein [Acinetobacter johnsonii]OOW16004.1 methyltransferase [Acinetobacter sp. MF4640]
MAESIVKELAPMIFQVIAQIPYGRVASYGQIARLAGIPKHSRLVGYVLKHMDADSSLPWYRVINSQGKISLSKLNDQGQNIQAQLLMAEGILVIGDKVKMKEFQWNI